MALTTVPSSCLFFKRQTRYAQTSDVLKNKQLDGTVVKAKFILLISCTFLNKIPGNDLLSHGETPHYHRRKTVSRLSSRWIRWVQSAIVARETWCLGEAFLYPSPLYMTKKLLSFPRKRETIFDVAQYYAQNGSPPSRGRHFLRILFFVVYRDPSPSPFLK